MTDEQILTMLEDVITYVDYDIAKSIFDDTLTEDLELAGETRERIIHIVRKYIE